MRPQPQQALQRTAQNIIALRLRGILLLLSRGIHHNDSVLESAFPNALDLLHLFLRIAQVKVELLVPIVENTATGDQGNGIRKKIFQVLPYFILPKKLT